MGKLTINDKFQQQTVCLPEGTSTSRQPTQPSIGPIPLLGWDRTEPTHASGKRFMNPPQKKTRKKHVYVYKPYISIYISLYIYVYI